MEKFSVMESTDEEQMGLLEQGRGEARYNRLEDRKYLEDEWSIFDYCSYCFGRTKASEVTEEEREMLWQLRRRVVNESCDKESDATNKMLCDIWNTLHPDDLISIADKSERWKRIGFQGLDPRTDLRTGKYCLEQLHFFVTEFKETARSMVKEAENEADYLFAIAGFNMTSILVIFFDLNTRTQVSPAGADCRAERGQLKNFVRLCVKEENPRKTLDLLFCYNMMALHKHWSGFKRRTNATLLEFPKSLRRVYQVNDEFWKQRCDQVDDFSKLLQC